MIAALVHLWFALNALGVAVLMLGYQCWETWAVFFSSDAYFDSKFPEEVEH